MNQISLILIAFLLIDTLLYVWAKHFHFTKLLDFLDNDFHSYSRILLAALAAFLLIFSFYFRAEDSDIAGASKHVKEISTHSELHTLAQ